MKTFIHIFAFAFLWFQPVAAEPAEASFSDLAAMFDRPCLEISIPKPLAMAIAQVESGLRPWVLNIGGRSYPFGSKAEALAKAEQARKTGQSYDVGLMQINNWWLDRYEISLEAALDPLANIYFGCWILKGEISRHATLRGAIGAYHSPDPVRADRYASIVLAALEAGPKPGVKTRPKKAKTSTGNSNPSRRSQGQKSGGNAGLEASATPAPMTVFSGKPKAASRSNLAGNSNNSWKASYSNGKK